jgi:hypothetical protein
MIHNVASRSNLRTKLKAKAQYNHNSELWLNAKRKYDFSKIKGLEIGFDRWYASINTGINWLKL